MNIVIKSFLLIFFAFALYGVIHSLLASRKAKEVAEIFMGQSGFRWYRLAYNVFSFISLLPVLALAVILPDSPIYEVPFPWDIPLLLLQLAGAVFSIAASVQTGLGTLSGITQLDKNYPAAEKNRLATDGLYRYVRHPIYTGAILFLWTSPQLTWNGLALRAAFTLYFIIGGIVEEKKLVEEFGDEYRSYRMRTPMLIPWLKKSS
jgi:protein-S-isoprenylcysteine O-methyltransferase Ste14